MTDDECCDPNITRERDEFMKKCQKTHGTKLKVGGGRNPKVETVLEDNDNEEVESFVPIVPEGEPLQIPEQDTVDENGNPIPNLYHLHDTFVNMEVKLNKDKKELYGQVIGLCLNRNGNTIGRAHENPVLNTLMYKDKFTDGTSGVYAANIIAKNMWRSVNDEGCHEDLLHLILDHKFSKNVVKEGYVYDRKGN